MLTSSHLASFDQLFLLSAERVANVASALKAVKTGPHGEHCIDIPQ